jgi:hypothetical protein
MKRLYLVDAPEHIAAKPMDVTQATWMVRPEDTKLKTTK